MWIHVDPLRWGHDGSVQGHDGYRVRLSVQATHQLLELFEGRFVPPMGAASHVPPGVVNALYIFIRHHGSTAHTYYAYIISQYNII